MRRFFERVWQYLFKPPVVSCDRCGKKHNPRKCPKCGLEVRVLSFDAEQRCNGCNAVLHKSLNYKCDGSYKSGKCNNDVKLPAFNMNIRWYLGMFVALIVYSANVKSAFIGDYLINPNNISQHIDWSSLRINPVAVEFEPSYMVLGILAFLVINKLTGIVIKALDTLNKRYNLTDSVMLFCLAALIASPIIGASIADYSWTWSSKYFSDVDAAKKYIVQVLKQKSHRNLDSKDPQVIKQNADYLIIVGDTLRAAIQIDRLGYYGSPDQVVENEKYRQIYRAVMRDNYEQTLYVWLQRQDDIQEVELKQNIFSDNVQLQNIWSQRYDSLIVDYMDKWYTHINWDRVTYAMQKELLTDEDIEKIKWELGMWIDNPEFLIQQYQRRRKDGYPENNLITQLCYRYYAALMLAAVEYRFDDKQPNWAKLYQMQEPIRLYEQKGHAYDVAKAVPLGNKWDWAIVKMFSKGDFSNRSKVIQTIHQKDLFLRINDHWGG